MVEAARRTGVCGIPANRLMEAARLAPGIRLVGATRRTGLCGTWGMRLVGLFGVPASRTGRAGWWRLR